MFNNAWENHDFYRSSVICGRDVFGCITYSFATKVTTKLLYYFFLHLNRGTFLWCHHVWLLKKVYRLLTPRGNHLKLYEQFWYFYNWKFWCWDIFVIFFPQWSLFFCFPHRTVHVEPCVSWLGSQKVSSWTCSSRVPVCVLSWNRGWSQWGAAVLQKFRRGAQTSHHSTNFTADSKRPTEDTTCQHPDCTMCASNRHYCNAEWPESHLKIEKNLALKSKIIK